MRARLEDAAADGAVVVTGAVGGAVGVTGVVALSGVGVVGLTGVAEGAAAGGPRLASASLRPCPSIVPSTLRSRPM